MYVCRGVRTHHGATRDLFCIDLYNLQGRGGKRREEEGKRRGEEGKRREEEGRGGENLGDQNDN